MVAGGFWGVAGKVERIVGGFGKKADNLTCCFFFQVK